MQRRSANSTALTTLRNDDEWFHIWWANEICLYFSTYIHFEQ